MKLCEIDELYVSMSYVVIEINNILRMMKSEEGLRDVISNIREMDATISYVIAKKAVVKMKRNFTGFLHNAKTVIKWLDANEDKMIVDDVKISNLISKILSNVIFKNVIEKCRKESI